MKNIKEYIVESAKTYKNNVNANAKRLLEATMNLVDLSKLKPTNTKDLNRFDISKENEQMFVNMMNKTDRGNGRFPDFTAYTSQEYYEKILKNGDYTSLSTKEKADFDSEYGDIIVCDSKSNILWCVDLKVSEKFIGAVSLGSLSKFNDKGIYLCVNKSNKKYKIVSHKSLVDAVKEDRSLLQEPTNSYKGYPVKWEGEDLTSEWFVPGNKINNFE